MRRGGRRARVLAIATSAVLMAGSAPAAARVVEKRYLGGGVIYTKIRLRTPPNRVHILSTPLAEASTFDVVLGSGTLPGFERTSSMARRLGAIAAVNGDYARPSGRPVMTFARDGRLAQTPLAWGRNFAVNVDESGAYVGHPKVQVTVSGIAVDGIYRIDRVNAGAPGRRQVALFTRAGGWLERPPRRSCSLRLVAVERPRLEPGGAGVQSLHRVGRFACQRARMRLKDGVVLATPRSGMRTEVLRRLAADGYVMLEWTVGWSGVLETVGGNPTLVEGGRVAVGRSSDPFFRRHPRTGIGVTAEGRVLMVTVDGRQPGYSAGMTLWRFARLLKNHGAEWALNLDGGGSTTMVVRGRVVNRPSDGSERPVSSALVVLPPDASARSGAATPAAARTWRRIATDPASTGGLADALDRSGAHLPRPLARAARTFDRRHR